jgi:hypothetical protein
MCQCYALNEQLVKHNVTDVIFNEVKLRKKGCHLLLSA